MSAGTGCQVWECRLTASPMPVPIILPSGTVLELGLCPGHGVELAGELEALELAGDEEQVA